MKAGNDWWSTFFSSFRPAFDTFNPKTNNAETRYFIKRLGLKSGMSFLDCPCGIGRISVPMAKKGIKVTGVDITKDYLEELSKSAKKKKLPITTVHKDMRRINFKNEFDAAGNIWTSFGYFEKETDNLLVLKKIHKALKPGGKFLLHQINRDFIMRHFRLTDWFQVEDTYILDRRVFDFETSRIIDKWKFIDNGQVTEKETSIRMYSYHEIISLMEEVRFVNIEGTGSIKDDPISPDNQMMIITGTKVF